MRPVEMVISRMLATGGTEEYGLTFVNIQDCLAAPPGGFQINVSSSGFTASTRYSPTTKAKGTSIPDVMVKLIGKLLDTQSNIRYPSINIIFEKASHVAHSRKVNHAFLPLSRP
jgi:hypothetical protein